MNIQLSKNGNRNNLNILCYQKLMPLIKLRILNLVVRNQAYNLLDQVLMFGISLSKVNSEATYFSNHNQKQAFLLPKVNFNSKIQTKVLWDSLQVVLINNLLLDQLFNKLLLVYLHHNRHSLPKLVVCLEVQLNYLLSLNLIPYLEELLNHKINQERTYLD